MKIRKATENDIPAIVQVLKASLGEDQLELSEKVWRYKHVDNPYGKSIVLIAEENSQIIGVRALMRWQWQQGEMKYEALRAVDTATHPKHQGKGIFKKLTLQAIEIAKKNGDHFIFNTPNEQSRPGYLKMGWDQVGKVNIGIKPSLNFLKFKLPTKYKVKKKNSISEIDNLCGKWNTNLRKKSGLFTIKSAEILKWRYEKNPLQKYEVVTGEGYYIAAYIKNRGKVKEFRIAECIFDEKVIGRKELQKVIKKIGSGFSFHVMSFSPKLLSLNGKKGDFGPILTLNALNLRSSEETGFLNIKNWHNSLGDLELF
ncbi:Acetyltransferase (GNAT) domain-containing protein [Salegentibacter echinorum]|uniref:Acetyltransferase (GNAT) domain-containing protein n=1 Tax=Salegentibacter echinorum TaxID=1073325 RepID=A0A1M5FJ17_SALEC|nr:GNAT family N-acetyltransferase [Salegentibacter echinorum]SHF91513.1 Acetyltransferase (GNAT) domain-containing protein [Salegentibacter echinorum]